MKIEVDIAGKSYPQAMKAAEQAIIVAALNRANCNKRAAAEAMGLTYDTFRQKVAALNLTIRAEAGR